MCVCWMDGWMDGWMEKGGGCGSARWWWRSIGAVVVVVVVVLLLLLPAAAARCCCYGACAVVCVKGMPRPPLPDALACSCCPCPRPSRYQLHESSRLSIAAAAAAAAAAPAVSRLPPPPPPPLPTPAPPAFARPASRHPPHAHAATPKANIDTEKEGRQAAAAAAAPPPTRPSPVHAPERHARGLAKGKGQRACHFIKGKGEEATPHTHTEIGSQAFGAVAGRGLDLGNRRATGRAVGSSSRQRAGAGAKESGGLHSGAPPAAAGLHPPRRFPSTPLAVAAGAAAAAPSPSPSVPEAAAGSPSSPVLSRPRHHVTHPRRGARSRSPPAPARAPP